MSTPKITIISSTELARRWGVAPQPDVDGSADDFYWFRRSDDEPMAIQADDLLARIERDAGTVGWDPTMGEWGEWFDEDSPQQDEFGEWS